MKFSSPRDNSTHLTIEVVHGEGEDLTQSESLGQFRIPILAEGAARYQWKCDVALLVDENNTVRVTAKQDGQSAGSVLEIIPENSPCLPSHEISAMVVAKDFTYNLVSFGEDLLDP